MFNKAMNTEHTFSIFSPLELLPISHRVAHRIIEHPRAGRGAEGLRIVGHRRQLGRAFRHALLLIAPTKESPPQNGADWPTAPDLRISFSGCQKCSVASARKSSNCMRRRQNPLELAVEMHLVAAKPAARSTPADRAGAHVDCFSASRGPSISGADLATDQHVNVDLRRRQPEPAVQYLDASPERTFSLTAFCIAASSFVLPFGFPDSPAFH